MNDVYEISLLLDFYGQLLTTRQYEILDLHYNNDYSLGEIAEQLNISRQGVFDNAKRGKATLEELERKLGLIMKFTEQKQKAREILEHINKIDRKKLDSEEIHNLSLVEEKIADIINSI